VYKRPIARTSSDVRDRLPALDCHFAWVPPYNLHGLRNAPCRCKRLNENGFWFSDISVGPVSKHYNNVCRMNENATRFQRTQRNCLRISAYERGNDKLWESYLHKNNCRKDCRQNDNDGRSLRLNDRCITRGGESRY
jgi:hypothetical protein